jgi:hydrogenase nickel incorporation protein HypA/HybF
MHELSLAEAIVGTIKNLCAQSAWLRVRRIVLKIGRMRQVDPELLVFALGVAGKGTVMEETDVSVMELPIVFKCKTCGQKSEGESMVFACSYCRSTNVDVISGMELEIESMEVEAQ